MASFSSLPPELVADIVELALPASVVGADVNERIKTLAALSKTSKGLRQPAQVLLYRHIAATHKSLPSLCEGLARQQKTRTLVVTRSSREKLLVHRLYEAIRRSNPSTLSVQGYHNFDFGEILHGLQVSNLFLHDVRLYSRPTSSFALASLRRLALYEIAITAPHLLFRSDVLPNLRSLALGEYQTVTAVEVDDESEGSDDDGDDHYRELDLDTTDFPLLPQLRALSAPHLPALALTSIEVLDAFSHDIRAVTLPRSLRVLRVVALLGPVPEPELAQVLQTLLSLEDLHLVGYKEEDEDSKSAWVDVRRWCADKGVKLVVDNPDDLFERDDPSFWRFLDSVQKRLGLDV